MWKFIKFSLYVIALFFIGASVYIASLPTKFKYTSEIDLEFISKKIVQNQLTHFENWKNWAAIDTARLQVFKSTDPLQSTLRITSLKEEELRVENEQLLDSLIIQKIYKKNNTVQELRWSIGKGSSVGRLKLVYNEQLSVKDKLYNLLGWNNDSRDKMLTLTKELTLLKEVLHKKNYTYQSSYIGKTFFGPINYVYLTSSGVLGDLENTTKQHLKEIESYLNEREIPKQGTPFTIYNRLNLETGVVLFSTAVPIAYPIEIHSTSFIRFESLEKVTVLETQIQGTPKSTLPIWRDFEIKKNSTDSLGQKKYVVTSIDNNYKSKSKIKQRLLWQVVIPNKEIKKDSLQLKKSDTIVRIAKQHF